MHSTNSQNIPRPEAWRDIPARGVVLLSALFVLLLPVPYVTSVKEIAFYGAAGLALIAGLLRRPDWSLRTPLGLPLIAFLLWASLGLFFTIDRPGTWHDLYSHLLRYCILYWILVTFHATREGFVRLICILVTSAALTAAAGLVYFYGFLHPDLTERFTAGFTEISPNLVGITTIFPLLAALHLIRQESRWVVRLLWAIGLTVLTIATVMTQTRGTLIALFAGLVLFFSRTLKTVALAGIGVSILLALLVLFTPVKERFLGPAVPYADVGGNIRWTIHHISLEVIKDHPIVGIGFGNEIYRNRLDWEAYNRRIPEKYRLSPETRQTYRTVINDPHNMFFSIAVRTGLVGLVLFLWILTGFFRMAWILMKTGDAFCGGWARAVAAGGIVFLVIGLFEPVFAHLQESVLFFLFAAMSLLWTLHRQQPEPKENHAGT